MDIEAALKGLQGAREMFLMVLNGTPDDRMEWKPACDGGDPTNIIEQARHSISAEVDLRGVLVEGKVPEDMNMESEWASSATFAKAGPAAGLSTKAEFAESMKAEADKTAEALQGIPAEAWGDMIETPFLSGPRAMFLSILIDHWSYHAGQIAYIQRLYGDMKFG